MNAHEKVEQAVLDWRLLDRLGTTVNERLAGNGRSIAPVR